jgi:adenosine deaminase
VLNERISLETLKSIPKIDLHRHLEGSLRLETLLKIAREHNLSLPTDDVETLRPLVQVTDDPPDHEVFLSKFEVLRRFYRSPEVISQLVYEVVADAAQDNVQYLELRFSPQALARVRRFSLVEVTDWVIDAVQQACQDFAIQVGLIITMVRHDPLEQAKKVAEIAFDYAGKGIVGIDLAGNEVKFPPGPFTPLFKKAKDVGLGVTVHAGEWASAHGVRQAIEELYADRIGHGVRTIENSHILRLARDRGTAFEVCLTSNLQTGVVRDMTHHPLVDMLDLGLRATLNTDDPGVSNCTLTDEYVTAVYQLGLGYRELRHMTLNAARAAFLPYPARTRLVAHFEKLLPQPDHKINLNFQQSSSIPFLHSPLN